MSDAQITADRWRLWLAAFIDLSILPTTATLLYWCLVSKITLEDAALIYFLSGFCLPVIVTGATTRGRTIGSALARVRPILVGDASLRFKEAIVGRFLVIAIVAFVSMIPFCYLWFMEMLSGVTIGPQGVAHLQGPHAAAPADSWGSWRLVIATSAMFLAPGTIGGVVSAVDRSSFVNTSRPKVSASA